MGVYCLMLFNVIQYLCYLRPHKRKLLRNEELFYFVKMMKISRRRDEKFIPMPIGKSLRPHKGISRLERVGFFVWVTPKVEF
jgi:hypothetical protein